jgi:hypothetical protein
MSAMGRPLTVIILSIERRMIAITLSGPCLLVIVHDR